MTQRRRCHSPLSSVFPLLLEERLNEPRPGGKNIFLIGALCSGALRRLEETKLNTLRQLQRMNIFLRVCLLSAGLVGGGVGGGDGVVSGLTRSDPACSFLAFVCRCGSDLSCRCRLMKQARRWWADISLGATFFDVISSVLAADKWRRPLLTAEALISGKEKKQKNKAAPFALRHVKTASSVRCVLVNTTGSGFIYQSVCFHTDVELGSCLCPSLHASECVFFFFFVEIGNNILQ